MSRSLGVGPVAVLVGVLVSGAPIARADDEPIGDDLRAEGQAHYDRGKTFFGDGDFVAAAVEFRQAEVLLAPVAVNADGSVKNKDARELMRRAISNEATAYSQ